MSDWWSTLSQSQEGLVLESYSWSFVPLKRRQGVSGRALFLNCLVFSNKTGSADLWVSKRAEICSYRRGCFLPLPPVLLVTSFFCDTDPQLSFVSKAVIPLTVPYEMWQTAVPQAANCSLYWHLLCLVLLHGSASSMARAVYILEHSHL